MNESSVRRWVTIKTTRPTRPFPPNSQREPVKSRRLTLRPFNDDEIDLKAFHLVRSDPEAMKWSNQGRPDANLEETYTEHFSQLIPPADTNRFTWAICLTSSGECIGYGGGVIRSGGLGWPEVGYSIRRDAWGQGYATEFVEAFLKLWWTLPRETVEIEVDSNTAYGNGEVKPECILGVTLDANKGSIRVLEKNGFELRRIWEEEDFKNRDQTETLYGWILKRDIT